MKTNNNQNNRPFVILMAEDDSDDQLLVKEALAESEIANDLIFVKDGVELLDYLRKKGTYAERNNSTPPDLILLDLNLPRKDGRETLKEIKKDPLFRQIPVVILTTSQDEEDVSQSYYLGANSYVSKPVTYSALVKIMKILTEYWVDVVKRPCNLRYGTENNQ